MALPTDQGAAANVSDPVKRHPVEFTADAGEYFRIWIVNLALTIVTLGIYSPRGRGPLPARPSARRLGPRNGAALALRARRHRHGHGLRLVERRRRSPAGGQDRRRFRTGRSGGESR